MTKDLTDARARHIKPSDKPRLIGGVTGLYLHPTRTAGRGKWILRFVSPVTGKWRDMGLGSYPEIGIAAARHLGLDVRYQIAANIDPIALRNDSLRKVESRRAIPNFETCARKVHASIAPGFRNPKHVAQWLTSLESHVFPAIGANPVDELRAADFAKAFRPIWLSKPETASRIKQRCDTIMKWCTAQDLVTASPVSVVTQLLPRQPGLRERVEHHPAVPWRAMPAFYTGVLLGHPSTQSKRVLEVLVLTAARSGEVRNMRWKDIDLVSATWTIPREQMKAKAFHNVPLGDRALSILHDEHGQRDGSEFVFPSKKGTPISDMALTKLLRDAKVASDIPNRHATAHGFRSSFRDWASENGYRRDLAERALAHTIRSSTEAAYHRTDLLEERRMMMQAWEAFIVGKL